MEEPMVTVGHYINITTNKHDVFICFNEPNFDPPQEVRNKVEEIATDYITTHEPLDLVWLRHRLDQEVEFGVQVVEK